MASQDRNALATWHNSPACCAFRKIRLRGSNACAASGNDRAARHERRALSPRRPVGRAASRWKLRRVGDHGNGVARLAVAHDRRRKEDPRISWAAYRLRIDAIDSWTSRAAQERATFKAPGCCRVRDSTGVWRRALDEGVVTGQS